MAEQLPFKWLPHRAPAVINKLLVFLLHSPLHWLLSNNMLLLTFTGRVSGQQFSIPVSYFLSQGKIVKDIPSYSSARDDSPQTGPLLA